MFSVFTQFVLRAATLYSNKSIVSYQGTQKFFISSNIDDKHVLSCGWSREKVEHVAFKLLNDVHCKTSVTDI